MGGGVPRLFVMSSQRVMSQKSVSRTVVIVTKSVDIGRCQTSPPSVPPLLIWYRPGGRGGGGKGGGSAAPKVKECSVEGARVGSCCGASIVLMLNVQSNQCSDDGAECQ